MKGIIPFLLGLAAGWVLAYSAAAVECKRLGGFYVGNTTYTCHVKEQK